MSRLDADMTMDILRSWYCRLPRFTQITDILDNTTRGLDHRRAAASSVSLPDIPKEGNAEALPLILALQQHPLPAREFRPLTCVLLALHGGKARP